MAAKYEVGVRAKFRLFSDNAADQFAVAWPRRRFCNSFPQTSTWPKVVGAASLGRMQGMAILEGL